jgi:hypothetical protein
VDIFNSVNDQLYKSLFLADQRPKHAQKEEAAPKDNLFLLRYAVGGI